MPQAVAEPWLANAVPADSLDEPWLSNATPADDRSDEAQYGYAKDMLKSAVSFPRQDTLADMVGAANGLSTDRLKNLVQEHDRTGRSWSLKSRPGQRQIRSILANELRRRGSPLDDDEPAIKISALSKSDRALAVSLAKPRDGNDAATLDPGRYYIAPDQTIRMKLPDGGSRMEKWWEHDAPVNREQALQHLYNKEIEARGAPVGLSNVYASAIQAGAAVAAPALRPVAPYSAAQIEALASAREGQAEQIASQQTDHPIIARAARGAMSTLPSMMAAGSVSGPYGALTMAGAQEASSSYHEARVAGLALGEAAIHSAKQGVAEAGIGGVFQKLGLGGLEDVLGGNAPAVQKGVMNVLKKAGITTLKELPEEAWTTFQQTMQNAISGVDLQADTPENIGKAMGQTALQTLMSVGAAHGIQAATKPSERAAQAAQFANPENVASVWSSSKGTNAQEALQKLAQSEKPSRSDWKAAGLPEAFTSARSAFTDELRKVIQSESQAVQAEGSPSAEPESPTVAPALEAPVGGEPVEVVAQAPPEGAEPGSEPTDVGPSGLEQTPEPTAPASPIQAAGEAADTEAPATLTASSDVLRLTPGKLPGGKLGGDIAGTLKKWMTSAGNLPQEAFDLSLKKDGRIARELKQLEFEVAGLKDALIKSEGTDVLSEGGRKILDAALHGDQSAMAQLTPPVQEAATAARAHVDALSRRLIDNGLATDQLEMTIEENMGAYLTRSYQVFDDPKWKDKVREMPEVWNKAFTFLKRENPGQTDQQLRNLMDDMLTELGAKRFLSKGKLGSKDLSITKKRKDIAPEIRALLGEYKDPVVNFTRSITKMAKLAANHEFLTEVREAGMGKFFFEESDHNRPEGYNSTIAAESTDAMAPLNGLKTTEDIKAAFDGMFGPRGPGGDLWDQALRHYMKVVAFSKYAKTVGNFPQGWARNFFGNPLLAIQAGHWNVAKLLPAFRATSESLEAVLPYRVRQLMGSDKDLRARVLRYVELGVQDQSVEAEDLREALDMAMRPVPAEVESNPFYRGVRKGGRLLQEGYQSMDNVWRIAMFESELARYRSAYEKAGQTIDESALEEQVSGIIRNTFPTYSMIPQGVRSLRRTPVVGTFVSFPSEVIRTFYHTGLQAASELQDPVLRGIGAQRAVGMAAALALPSAVTAAFRAILGITKDDDEDLRKFLPPWSENSDILWLYRGVDGQRPGYIDLSFTVPNNILRKPVVALLRGDDWHESFVGALNEFRSPFFSEDMLTEKVIDVARNTKQIGGRVFNPQASAAEKAVESAKHIGSALEPGAVSVARRNKKAWEGYVEKTGRTYGKVTEAMAAIGFRAQEIDIPTALSREARMHAENMREATAIFSTVYGSRGTVSAEDIANAHASMEQSRRKLFDEMHAKAGAAIHLGMSEKEVVRALDEAGVAQDEARRIVRGFYEPYKLTKQFASRLKGNPNEEMRQAAYKQAIGQ